MFDHIVSGYKPIEEEKEVKAKCKDILGRLSTKCKRKTIMDSSIVDGVKIVSPLNLNQDASNTRPCRKSLKEC